ncbi:MFS transporter [Nonomuraea sp. NPDC003804]|uniref:MFS transporter n=1 Tax=Nonomuraea sp. NPDC003804 TaxID=3154547 RepID=UPI0033AE4058
MGLLRHRGFLLLFGADTISQVGTQVSMVALPLVAVVALRASPFEMGLLVAAETAAFLLIGLPAGVWVDRLRRRPILITGDLARAALLASVPVAWWLGVLSMPQLYVVGLCVSVATVFFDVAYQSYLPSLVERDRIVEGNAKLEIVRSGAQVAGPGAAGWLVHLVTAPVAILVDAVSFLLSGLLLAGIKGDSDTPARDERRGLVREIGEGLAFVLRHPILRMIAACTASANLANAMNNALAVLFLINVVGVSPGVMGLLFSAAGVGGLAGAALVGPVSRWAGSARTIWLSALLTSPFMLLVPLAAQGWRLGLYVLAWFVVSAGIVVYNVSQLSFRQAITPDHLLGRMNATMRFIVWGTLPLGALIGGVLGERLGVVAALWIACALSPLSVIPLLLSPLRTMRDLPQQPPGR